MKLLTMVLVLLSFISCDPFSLGFKKNPAFILEEAFRAIQNLDRQGFRDVAAKEAVCLYGNDQGLEHLKVNLDFKPEEIDVIPTLNGSRHFSSPLYVGYWSYYQERYSVEIYLRGMKKLIIVGIVDCDFGTDEQKNDRLINQKPSKYKMKECRIVKIVPKAFEALPESMKCGVLKV